MRKTVLFNLGLGGVDMLLTTFDMIRDHGSTWMTPVAGGLFVSAVCICWISSNILFESD